MAAQPATTPQDRPVRFGLAARVLALIIVFVMLAEVAIYVPSIANFRNTWLRDRLAAARIAALVLEAAPKDMVPEALKQELLSSVGAKSIVLKMHDTRRLLAVSDMPPQIDETYDLREPSAAAAISAAFRALTAPPGRNLNVVGNAPMGADFVEITIDEAPLKAAMLRYSVNILGLSLFISALVAILAALALHWMVLRPVRRLTSSLMDFGQNPEDASRIIEPSGAGHEIGRAEEALAGMQGALSRELKQKKHLAALGLAVAKINHDLRNMLSSAQLFSDRLSAIADPVAQRLAPKLVATLDRAIRFCQSTLAYGSAAEAPPTLRRVALRAVAEDVVQTLTAGGEGRVIFQIDVPEKFEMQADAEHVFRMLLNLTRNSREALESTGPAPGLPARIILRARREIGATVIEVADTGPGVPQKLRANLFEAFHTSTRPGGSGLGLAIAADLARAHGGMIELTDATPGATFRITLPERGNGAGGR